MSLENFQFIPFFECMNILELENFLGNSSFFFLFFSMSTYWIQLAFSLNSKNFGKIFMSAANFCLFALLSLRWKESGHFPLSNLYESLMFLSWSLSTFHLIVENIDSLPSSPSSGQSFFRQKTSQNGIPPLFGAFTSPTVLFTNAFATFSLPLEMQNSSPLVPALQSNWLMMHVTVMILSYSALICGSLLSIAFLIVTRNFDIDSLSENSISQENSSATFFDQTQVLSSASLADSISILPQGRNEIRFSNSLNLNQQNSTPDISNSVKKEFAENLDNLSYRILGIGFPFLTIGILSGAVWANEAWGSYWSWDPKETWALATWLVFAIYLHTRFTKGWRGKKPAFIASFGFLVVWICFLGVNLLGEGLHSYGFFQ